VNGIAIFWMAAYVCASITVGYKAKGLGRGPLVWTLASLGMTPLFGAILLIVAGAAIQGWEGSPNSSDLK